MNKKYNLIDTEEKLIQLDKILMADNKPRYDVLSVDTETNGLLLYRSTVVGFSVSFDSKSGFYVPLLKWVPDPKSFKRRKIDKKQYESFMDGELECVWTGARFPEFVKPHEYNISERFPLIPALVERWFMNTNLWMWNAPFDVNMFFSNMKSNGQPIDMKNALHLDGSLMTHILNENESVALKSTAERYKTQLGINPHAMAAQEKAELIESIRNNGGKRVEVWRADLDVQCKYACADTFLTHGLCEVAIQEFHQEFGDAGMKWFFEDEVMPVCKEVVIDMKRRGIYTDVKHFAEMQVETQNKLNSLEDGIVEYLTSEGLLKDFTIGKSLDEAVSRQRLIKKIIELENLAIPKKYDKKTDKWKETIAKGEVKKVNEKEPHWIWGYILGEDEIRYSDEKLTQIKKDLYVEVENRRYRFNIKSDAHLRWLFCEKYGFNPKGLPQTDSATKDNPIPSMKAEVLEEYMLPKIPWVKDLLLFKKLQKLQSSYINNAVNLHLDGWLYMDMKQNGTKSGRFSCSGGFNLQTLPKVEELDRCPNCKTKTPPTVTHTIKLLADVECHDCGYQAKDVLCSSAIKAGFIAPPGYKIVNADYSSLEPRCFAYMSGDEKIKDVYKKGLDLYSQIYCTMFPDGKNYSPDPKDKDRFLKKVAPDKRSMVKPIVLGIPYGASAYQVASMCGYTKSYIDRKTGQEKIVPDTERGAELRDLYLTTFYDLHNYMKNQERMAIEEGYVTTIVGRKRHFKYAKKINDILKQYGISYEDVIHASPSSLKKGLDISYVSERGAKITLNKEIMTAIKDALDLDWDKIYTKGLWGYIRNLIKADINEACNNPIQGLGAHITNKGMLDTTRGYRQNKVDAWVCLQVHDEITSYAKIEEVDKAVEIKQKGMEDNDFAHLIDIPMIAEPLVCNNLKESK